MNHQTKEDRLDLLVLAWLGCQAKPFNSAAVAKALNSFEANGSAIEVSLQRLIGANQVQTIQPAKKKAAAAYSIAPAGASRVAESLGVVDQDTAAKKFAILSKFHLPAVALGLAIPRDTKSQKELSKQILLAVCCAEHHLDVPVDRSAPAASLALVKLALSRSQGVGPERIHLKQVTDGPLAALVVGPLLGIQATAAAKIAKLIESEACRILGISKAAGPQLAPAVIRHWLSEEGQADAVAIDPQSFAQTVLSAARQVAQSNPRAVNNLGDQVLIHYCWKQYQHSAGPISLEVFKRQLSELNGEQLVLVREDLIPEARAAEFAESEVRTGASSYHYIRLQQ